MKKNVILDVKNLKVFYGSPRGPVRAVDGVSFQVYENEILGLVGESGCGKTTLTMGVMNFLKPPCYIESGEVQILGKNILDIDDEDLRKMRLAEMSYVPQSSMSALNPVMRIGGQIVDGIVDHQKTSRKEAEKMAIELLNMCGLPSGTDRMYPHELSGGMRQRATIAAALALRPKLIIADEPTTALDVVVQRTILEFFVSFKERFGSSIIVVTHDISIQSEICDRIMVMYGGKIVEMGPVKEIFYHTKHPYTKALIGATPTLSYVKELVGMTGRPPSLINPPIGCRFASRCPHSKNICTKEEPKLVQIGASLVACHMCTSNKW